MRNFLQRFSIFMQGRYGTDKLNNFLVVVFFLIWFSNLFVFNRIASLILFLVQSGILALVIFRSLSRNIAMRSLENRRFSAIYDPIQAQVKLTWKKFRDRKDFRYLKCPVCKAQLRVKNKKGTHIVRCPRCGSEFEKKI